MVGIVFVNPSSGKDGDDDEIREAFASHHVVVTDPSAFGDQIASALEDKVDFVGVAGGDGTIRTAAQVLRGGDIPLLPIPAGTRNHFAKDVGNDSFDKAAAATDGRRMQVDLGDVNGQCFVNNSSIGLYPKIVIRREAKEHRLPKWMANLVAVYEQLRHGHRFQVELDGEVHLAWMAFVGNGQYGEGLLDLSDRESLDQNLLDVRVVKADRPMARTRVVLALMLGRLAGSPLVHQTKARSICLELDRESIEVALDGEVKTLKPPLRYESQPKALLVLVPPD